MGAQAAMMLAQRHHGFYRAVAGISGCYSTADEVGQAVTRITVASTGGNPENLWGPPNSPEWAAHDSYLGAGDAVVVTSADHMPRAVADFVDAGVPVVGTLSPQDLPLGMLQVFGPLQ